MKAMRTSDPAHLKAAYADLGLKEIRGSRHNPRVVEMFALSGHGWVKDDETAWCAAAMGAWLKEAGMVGSGSLAARSYLKWGKKTTKPKRGDVVVFKRGNSTWQGHVALYLGQAEGRIYVIGGNQSNRVSVTRYPKSKLLGYRKPSTAANSKVVRVVAGAGVTTAFGLADAAEYVPEAVSLASSVDPNYLMIGIAVIAIAVCGFLIWDRMAKARELGV